ncbi:armadillo-type protein [Baffinella frigidus]|nr:armadillo-type protein [Cryptophyta sp. CCMP2293]
MQLRPFPTRGREAFVGALLAGLALDSNELREYTYGALANLSIVMQKDMAPLLPAILPYINASIDSEDGLSLMPEHGAAAQPFGNLCVDSDDEDEDNDPRALHVRTAWLDEKASAVHCMGALAEGMKGDFAPHLEAAVACVNKLKGYFHEDVRQGVQAALQKLLMVSFEAHTAPLRAQAAAAGQDASAILHPTTALLLDEMEQVMEELIGTMQHDDDKETACEAIALLSKPLGAQALSKVMVRIVEALKMLLEGGAPCQAEDEEADEEGGEEDDDEEDHDQVLIDAVADLVGCLAEATKEAFAPHFEILFPPLKKFLRPKRQVPAPQP